MIYCDDSNASAFGNIKNKIGGVVINKFFWLKPKIYSILVSRSSKYKKRKGVNKNVVTRISNNEYKNLWLNKKCSRHSMNWIQNKSHGIRIYEINKVSLYCFDYKIYILVNRSDVLALGY